MSGVHIPAELVCPMKDIVCGNIPENWCEYCALRLYPRPTEQLKPKTPMTTNFRVHRTYTWERIPGQEVRFGGPPPALEKIAHDKLQYQTDLGRWVDVPIFVAEDPENPQKAKHLPYPHEHDFGSRKL